MPPTFIHYLELRGSAAQAQLAEYAQGLRLYPDFVDAALLYAPAQQLWLLETRWQTAPPELAWPAEAKAWAFEVREFITAVKD